MVPCLRGKSVLEVEWATESAANLETNPSCDMVGNLHLNKNH